MNKRENTNHIDREGHDARHAVIGSVWLAALAILGMSIPLIAAMRTASLPVLIVIASVAFTAIIWKNGGEKAGTSEKEAEAMRRTIHDLEERLENVEVINRFEERLAEKELRREAPGSSVADEVDERFEAVAMK